MQTTESASKQIGKVIGECFKRLFSEARLLARIKLWSFTSFLAFVGLGFGIKITSTGGAIGTHIAEFILSAPGPAQAIAALIALLIILLLNLQSRKQRDNYEKYLLDFINDRKTNKEAREAALEILKKLRP